MPTKHTTTAERLANYLSARGIPALPLEGEDESVDSEVTITPYLHVQVGANYFIVVREERKDGSDPVFYFGNELHSASAVLAELRIALH